VHSSGGQVAAALSLRSRGPVVAWGWRSDGVKQARIQRIRAEFTRVAEQHQLVSGTGERDVHGFDPATIDEIVRNGFLPAEQKNGL
jgi:hypothetical protein